MAATPEPGVPQIVVNVPKQASTPFKDWLPLVSALIALEATIAAGFIGYNATTDASRARTNDADRLARQAAYVAYVSDAGNWDRQCFELEGRIESDGSTDQAATQALATAAEDSDSRAGNDVLTIQLVSNDSVYKVAQTLFDALSNTCDQAALVMQNQFSGRSSLAEDKKKFASLQIDARAKFYDFVAAGKADLKQS